MMSVTTRVLAARPARGARWCQSGRVPWVAGAARGGARACCMMLDRARDAAKRYRVADQLYPLVSETKGYSQWAAAQNPIH